MKKMTHQKPKDPRVLGEYERGAAEYLKRTGRKLSLPWTEQNAQAEAELMANEVLKDTIVGVSPTFVFQP
jgi:hypothetical protein